MNKYEKQPKQIKIHKNKDKHTQTNCGNMNISSNQNKEGYRFGKYNYPNFVFINLRCHLASIKLPLALRNESKRQVAFLKFVRVIATNIQEGK